MPKIVVIQHPAQRRIRLKSRMSKSPTTKLPNGLGRRRSHSGKMLLSERPCDRRQLLHGRRVGFEPLRHFAAVLGGRIRAIRFLVICSRPIGKLLVCSEL
jgi:hypothetical protein